MLTRKKAAMILAEFLGAGFLTLAVLAISKSSIGIPYFVAIGAGITIAMVTLVLGAVSGAHANPLVTIGLWSIRRIKTVPAIVYVAAQLLGGIAAYFTFTYFVGQTWNNTGEFQSKVMVAEAVGGFIFSLGVAAVVFQKLRGGLAAAAIGLSLTIAILVASAGAGGIVNPAVALGARSWVWGTFVLGPILGGIIGFNLYSLLFAPASELVEAESDASVKVAKASRKK
jgi:glycerol uptake facilitator-like aquaporin